MMPNPVTASRADSSLATAEVAANSQLQYWQWQGLPVAYQTMGNKGPAVVLIHGFGASSYHWRQNIPVLAQKFQVYAIDLIGFGASAKPDPEALDYTFETWGQQTSDFCREVVGQPVFLVGNSIGCLVAMQAAVLEPEQVLGTALLNCSLRLLHDRKRINLPWHRRLGAPILQKVLRWPPIAQLFFQQLIQPKTIRKILLQAYRNPTMVTDELIDLLLAPARDPGAVKVFVAFTGYSQGSLPEDLLAVLPCPALLIWGSEDPWEPVDLGRELAAFPCVEDFIAIPGAGHCPQDEAPELVNPILENWIWSKAGAEPATAPSIE